jgi:hypothetical protein
MIKQDEYIEKAMQHIVYCWGLEWSAENEQVKWSDMQASLMFLFNCLPEKYLDKQWTEFANDVFWLSTIAFHRGWQLKTEGGK